MFTNNLKQSTTNYIINILSPTMQQNHSSNNYLHPESMFESDNFSEIQLHHLIKTSSIVTAATRLNKSYLDEYDSYAWVGFYRHLNSPSFNNTIKYIHENENSYNYGRIDTDLPNLGPIIEYTHTESSSSVKSNLISGSRKILKLPPS